MLRFFLLAVFVVFVECIINSTVEISNFKGHRFLSLLFPDPLPHVEKLLRVCLHRISRKDQSKFFANLLGTSQDRLSGLNSK
jgi:hypothetical protein